MCPIAVHTFDCLRCRQPFDNPIDRNEHQLDCRSAPAPAKPKRKDPGGDLEKLVRGSVKALAPHGLSLRQASPRTVGKHHRGGLFVGKVLGKGGLDFSGDFAGRAVMFDAKSCAVVTSFSLVRMEEHQVKKVSDAHARGAVGFFLIEFAALVDGPRYFALDWQVLKEFWERRGDKTAPQSIPFPTFLARCPEVIKVGKVLGLIGAIKAVAARTGAPA